MPKIKIKTIRGIPDHIFLRLEPRSTGFGDVVQYDEYDDKPVLVAPTIFTLKMSVFGEDIRSISSMSRGQLYQITRRNSHPRSSIRDLYISTGAVLLSKDDCANFNQWTGMPTVDIFELDIQITGYDSSHTELPAENTLIVTYLYDNYEYSGTYEKNEFWFTAKE